jgi:hypothetical protein
MRVSAIWGVRGRFAKTAVARSITEGLLGKKGLAPAKRPVLEARSSMTGERV